AHEIAAEATLARGDAASGRLAAPRDEAHVEAPQALRRVVLDPLAQQQADAVADEERRQAGLRRQVVDRVVGSREHQAGEAIGRGLALALARPRDQALEAGGILDLRSDERAERGAAARERAARADRREQERRQAER